MKKGINRVVLVGTGYVGASYAFAMLNQSIAEELVLVDVDAEKSEGEAMDLNHGLPFTTSPTRIWAGIYADCRDADIVVITAGANQRPGETRLDLVEKNARIFQSIVKEIMQAGFDGIIIVASNPVDIMTYVTWKYSGLPKEKVIGSGTTLDTARLRYMVGEYFAVDPRNAHAYIIGEHGDTELPVWSHAAIGGKPIEQLIAEKPGASLADLERIFHNVRDAAYDIINRKGTTSYGIAMGLARLTKAILSNENAVLTVSSYLAGEYGHRDIYIGVPAIVNRQGVREILVLNINAQEQEMLNHSVEVLKKSMRKIMGDS